MTLPVGVLESALRFVVKQRVKETLNPYFKGISELVAAVAEPETEVEVRKELLRITEQALGEIMNEMKLRAERPPRPIRSGTPRNS